MTESKANVNRWELFRLKIIESEIVLGCNEKECDFSGHFSQSLQYIILFFIGSSAFSSQNYSHITPVVI